MAVDPELLAEIARRKTAIPGANETYQWPVKQADGSDYAVPGGTNAPAGQAPAGVDPELLAEIARRKAAPASAMPAPSNGPSGLAADSTGVTPAPPSMVQSLMNYAQKEGAPIAGGMIGRTRARPSPSCWPLLAEPRGAHFSVIISTRLDHAIRTLIQLLVTLSILASQVRCRERLLAQDSCRMPLSMRRLRVLEGSELD